VRPLFTMRFVASIGAVILLAVAVNAVFVDGAPLEAVFESEIPSRRVDLIEPVQSFERSNDFTIAADGTTVGVIDAVLDDERIVRIAAGTPGEIACPNLRSSNRCVLFADLLGEAVLWFGIMPRGPNDTVFLPPILDLQEGYAIFENGWEIRYPPVIERDCGSEDIPTFSDFIRRFGPNSISIVDLETREVTRVVCGDEVVPVTTTTDLSGVTTGPDGVLPIDVEGVDPGAQAPEN
jgi:hypothetical protein